MAMSLDKFQSKLKSISEHNGVPYGRAFQLFKDEDKHNLEILRFSGYISLSDAFKCFFLETVELMNTQHRLKIPTSLPEFYGFFVARLVHSFQSLCGAERIAMRGYPYQAYTLLRNTFDNLQLTSATIQKFTDFYSIEGIERGKPVELKFTVALRKKTENKVRRLMSGEQSGLTQATIDELENWDELFDYEVHGARLWLATEAHGWLRGSEALPVLPKFKERSFVFFMNRFCEVGWMAHRLVPLFQPFVEAFGNKWSEKWRVLDECFIEFIDSLVSDSGKKAITGAAILEFVRAKFPFNENSTFY